MGQDQFFKLKANERNKSKLEEQFNTAEGE
jgi:hypothetical protein